MNSEEIGVMLAGILCYVQDFISEEHRSGLSNL